MCVFKLPKVVSKLPDIVFQIAECICPICKIYLSNLQNVFVQIQKHICLNFQLYLSRLQGKGNQGREEWRGGVRQRLVLLRPPPLISSPNIVVQIAGCICQHFQMDLSKLPNVFVQITRQKESRRGGVRQRVVLLLRPQSPPSLSLSLSLCTACSVPALLSSQTRPGISLPILGQDDTLFSEFCSKSVLFQ